VVLTLTVFTDVFVTRLLAVLMLICLVKEIAGPTQKSKNDFRFAAIPLKNRSGILALSRALSLALRPFSASHVPNALRKTNRRLPVKRYRLDVQLPGPESPRLFSNAFATMFGSF
jgi:hypothetical protein